MIEIRRILCPIDFSDCSRRALEHAVALARWYGARLTVLHVFSGTPVAAYAPGAPAFDPLVLSDIERDQLVASLGHFASGTDATGVTVEPAIREGSVVRQILDEAADSDPDLLVIGTHGRSGFAHMVLGSITEKVLRKAPCAVLTVPPPASAQPAATPVLFKRILCPVDFSDSSMAAFAVARSLAQEAGAQLTLLHVMAYELEDTPDMYDTSVTDEQLTWAEYRRRREAEIQQRLYEAAASTDPDACTVETRIARGRPGREILRVAGEAQSDLIVLGVHGRGAVELALLGSTTNRVVRGAACPVLTLRQG